MICQYQRFIQMARRNLGLDDDTYRAFLVSVTGKDSTKAMTKKERWRVVEALKTKGVAFESKTAKGSRKDAKKDDAPQTKLARHLWLTLKQYGVLRDSSEWALLSYVKKITGKDRFEWLDQRQMNKVIETLKGWVERVEAVRQPLPQSAIVVAAMRRTNIDSRDGLRMATASMPEARGT